MVFEGTLTFLRLELLKLKLPLQLVKYSNSSKESMSVLKLKIVPKGIVPWGLCLVPIN